MSVRALLDTFDAWRAAGERFVLVTVVETDGSTYSKAGTQLLLRADGLHAGLVSGGCLEGDLAEHARTVLDTATPALITYDMRDDADDLWGIGLGCNGLMRVLLQPLGPDNDWQPFTYIRNQLAAAEPRPLALVAESHAASLPAGSSSEQPAVAQLPRPERLPALETVDVADGTARVLFWETRPWPRVLVLGAGADAVPVVRLCRELGWSVTVADHRPHYLERNDFAGADACLHVNPQTLTEHLDPTGFDAVVIMSHHLTTDEHYLRALAPCAPAYIGVLGPAARKQKLLAALGDAAGTLNKHLRGPVGLPLRADSAETIALSLVSEIQQVTRTA